MKTKTKNALEKRIRRLMYLCHGQHGYFIEEKGYIRRLGIYDKVVVVKTRENYRRVDRPVASWGSLRSLIELIKELRYLEV